MPNQILHACAIAGLMVGAAHAAPSQPPPPAPSPVTETLYGVQVTDTWRGLEKLDPATIDWLKAQGRYTRELLGSIGPRAALLGKIADFTASFGPVKEVEVFGGRTFYLEQPPGSDNFNLVVRDAGESARTVVDAGKLRAEHGGTPYAINYYEASPDGSRVGVGVSAGGSEAAQLYVYDAVTGAQIAGPIDRTDFGGLSWTDDGKTLFFLRLQKTDNPQLKYFNVTDQVWDLKSEPRDVLGAPVKESVIKVPPVMGAGVVLTPGSDVALAFVQNGVQNEIEAWTGPVAKSGDPAAPWQRLVTRDDDVTSGAVRRDDLYLLSHKDAPTFKVLHVKAGQPLSAADVVLPAEPGRLVESIHAAADGLYVQARQGVYSQLLFIPTGGTPKEIALPAKGSVNALFTDPRKPGAVIQFESWAIPVTFYSYAPGDGRFTDLHLGAKPSYDAKDYVATDLKAPAQDGVQVPMTYLAKKGAARPGIVLVRAYGSYGISYFPSFNARAIPFLDEGGAWVTCNVRGGGELGEAWRLGGKDANKPNTWRDLIACGKALVAQGYTTPDKLFITGGSAGGITMGRALEEAPTLFAGVIDQVPAANTIRSEFSPNGPPNIPEFGTITNEAGFRNLYAMDSVVHVTKGVQYPAVMITTGLNDPRVSPWEPAKFAAALMSSGTKKPVLLRVEEQAGHGIGSTKSQTDGLLADTYSFVFWRAGRPGWAPAD
jgi:prolyl oligopeptidase